MTPTELFEFAIETLERQYSTHRFFMERDVVWTVQLQIIGDIERLGLPYRVFNDYDIGAGNKYPDLVVLDNDDNVEVAAEFKYEPSHDRNASDGGDIQESKFSVVSWRGENSVLESVQRVKDYVGSRRAKTAYSVLIDEGSYHRRMRKNPPPGCVWIEWYNGVYVLWCPVKR